MKNISIPLLIVILIATGSFAGVAPGQASCRIGDYSDNDCDGLVDYLEGIYGSDPKRRDTDRDRFPDSLEVMNGYSPIHTGRLSRNCIIDYGYQPLNDPERIRHHQVINDYDCDGLDNAIESAFSASFVNSDSDYDGYPDGLEVQNGYNPRGLGWLSPPACVSDYDSDGLCDLKELILVTDPVNPDTDFDGYPDGLEVQNGYNPRGPGRL